MSAHVVALRQGFFGVSVIAGTQMAFTEHFAGAKDVDRFEGALWMFQEAGALLLVGSSVTFDCRIATHHDGFSHTISVGEFHDILSPNENADRCVLWYRKGIVSIAAFGDREEVQ